MARVVEATNAGRLAALLFASAIIAAGWIAFMAPGYTWHVLGALAVLAIERLTYGTIASPWGWVNWVESAKHFLRVTAVCSAIILGLLIIAVVVIRVGEYQFEIQPKNIHNTNEFWGWFLFAVITAPLVEEWIYRGLIQPRLRIAVGPRWAIFLNGILFWIYHWVGHGQITGLNHLAGGWLFAWSWQRTNSLVAPTLLHAVGNLSIALGELLWLTHPEWVRMILGWSQTAVGLPG